MLKPFACMAAAAALLVSLAPPTERSESYFFSSGKRHKLIIDRNNLAIQTTGSALSRALDAYDTKALVQFESLGITIIEASKIKASDSVVGHPAFFAQDETAIQAVAILTNEIVIRELNERSQKLVSDLAGYVESVPLKFSKGLHIVRFASAMEALAGANTLHESKSVKFAHPNFLLPKVWRAGNKKLEPFDEPLFNQQWHLRNTGQNGGTAGADIGITAAWNVTRGTPSVKVAILDGGFEITHPDLKAAWYKNERDIAGNGIDDEGNGYIDDVSGWNFKQNTNDPGTGQYADHGTAVSGLVGGRLNGLGIIGTCPECELLPIVVAWEAVKDAEAFYYAANQGADVITNSWGYSVGTPVPDVVREAIDYAATQGRGGKGMPILFAMNNIDRDDCIGETPDISSLESVVAISASSDLDKKVTRSAWGDCMELLAPSYESMRAAITTTDVTGRRGYNSGRIPGDLEDLDYTSSFTGTSASTPIAAGVFALMLSANEDLARDDLLGLVLSTAEKVHPDLAKYDDESGFSRKYGYGRLDAARAVRAAQVFRKYTSKPNSAAEVMK